MGLIMSYTISSITVSPEEYQARLTHISHCTIEYLCDQGYLSQKEAKELLEHLIVVPVNNNSLFGRLRERLFGGKEDKNFSKYIVTQI
jgi:hypothetical protein